MPLPRLEPKKLPKEISVVRLTAECSQDIYYSAPYDSCESLEFENGMTHEEFLILNPELDCDDLRTKPKKKLPICLSRCVPANVSATTKIPKSPVKISTFEGKRKGPAPDCDLPYVALPFENCDSLFDHLGLTVEDFTFLNPGMNCNQLALGTQICIRACIP